MYNNVLLFGSRGHLARTKLIPALKSQNIDYVPLSRQRKVDLDIYKSKNNIAYMSIPTQHFFQAIDPYFDFFNINRPLFVLEKPHGINEQNFLEIDDFLGSNGFQSVYNDHYIAKNSILNIQTMQFPEFKNMNYIDIKLHESSCVNDRVEYFDKVGILLDMYQSHVLIVLSTLLSQIEQIPRIDVLRHIAKCIPYDKKFSKYNEYKGSSFTKCDFRFIYKGIGINVSCGKKLTDEKSLCLYTNKGSYCCIDLSNTAGNPYEQIFSWLREGSTDQFLTNKEISLLWKHINLF